MSNTEIITLSALVINTLALLFVISQTILSRKSLNATKQSIEEAKRARQLEALPKFGWVIHVQVDLEKWHKDLLEKKEQLEKAIIANDGVVLQQIAERSPQQPRDLRLPRFLYQNMPSWIREIWMSGAQHYYNAASPLLFLWRDNEPNFSYAKSWTNERGKESIDAISILLDYIKDMVPPVILDTPASINEEEFLRN
jgi:hypothetical protein